MESRIDVPLRWVLQKFGVLAKWLSGELLLKHYHNGSTVILARTIWIAMILYSVALLFRSLSYTTWPSAFDFGQLGKDIAETLPWLGALAGGVYAALYARFSSQWTYLANVYHQMKAAQVAGPKDQGDHQIQQIEYWKAAFIEDAQDLHLVTKKMFAVTAFEWLREPGVADKFANYTVGGHTRREELQQKLRDVISRQDKNFDFGDDPASDSAPVPDGPPSGPGPSSDKSEAKGG